ncbi:IS110 family transposase [Vibrio mediterranei]|uniref:IS110 family transposase n=1 Tax=Vibrio mediterranei TaxID=689 RepID=UPI0022837C5F|nr:IS110 family transposase [Vibrio mediterranei]MCY9855666.1 IS110 family transposase [Vibrio mediterranei]
MATKNVIAIDLAKNVLQACHINVHGELLSNKPLSRQKMKEFLVKAKPSIVAMEGCCGSHYWGRLAESFGHEVRIINPKKVKGYLEGHKTDHNDALAIVNAALQIGIKYSQPKSLEQQSMQSLESSRRFLSRSVVSLGQHIRGTILSYGIANPKGEKGLKASVQTVLDGDTSIPANVVSVLSMLWEQYKELKAKLIAFEKEKNALTRQIEPCQRLMDIEGVGETTAAMLYSTLGDGKQFKNGRQASAFVGLTPKQHSSGCKVFMIGIDKYGGVKELRSLLYLGAMSYVGRLPEKPKTQKDAWLKSIIERIGFKKACIALANKVVRTAWAMLRYETEYKPVLLID